jgi:hypothetical protein
MLLYSPVVWYYLFHQSRSAATLNVTIFGVEGALLGIRSMTGLGIEYLTGPWLDMRSGALVLVVRFLGVILGVPLLVSCVGAIWYFARVGILNELRSPRGAIFLTIILHGGLAFVAGLHTHPQYFNAIWIFFLFLVGFFVAQKSRRFDLLAVRAALVGNALTIVTILVLAHQNHGMRCIRYGSSIGEKWRIAGEINERSSLSSVVLPDDVAPFPHAFEIMAELDRLAYSRRSLEPSTPLTLRWRYPDAPIDCELMLVSSAFSVSESRLPHP